MTRLPVFYRVRNTHRKTYGYKSKETVRKVEREDGVLIFDDTIQEKPYTDENEIMCWHYDHSKGRAVQGFNLLNCLYHVEDISIPVAFELIKKPIEYSDLKTRKRKRASLVTKNELMREMIQVCVHNKLLFRFVLFDTWFSSKEKHALHQRNHPKGFYLRTQIQSPGCGERSRGSSKNVSLGLKICHGQKGTTFMGWLKEVPFPVKLVRQIYENKDGSTGILYLACSDTTMNT